MQKAATVDSVLTPGGTHETVMEPKLDGVRALVHVGEDGAVTLFTRAGHGHNLVKFPRIREELALVPADSWLDGELWSADGFGKAQGALGTADPQEAALKAEAADLMFYVFDLLRLGGTDTRDLLFRQRREYLERLAKKLDWDAAVRLLPQHEVSEETYDAYLNAGFEGAIVKALDARYRKRGGWWKVKPTLTEDYVVMGFEEGSNGWAGGPGKIVFGHYDGGALTEFGKVRIKDEAMREAATADPDSFKGRVLEVIFQERTDDGRLRFPRFLRWRDDKPAEECKA